MMAFNLKNVLKAKGIDKPLPWLTSRSIKKDIANRLLSGKTQKISIKYIEMFCYDLNITPNDLYIWQPDAKHRDIAAHPLQELRSDNKMPDLAYYGQRLSIAGMRKTEKFMKQLQQEEAEERKKIIEEKRKKKG